MTDQNDRQDAGDRPGDYDVPEQETEAEEAAKPELDWGLTKPKFGMGKEIKFGVAAVAVVLGLFGYIAWQNMSDTGTSEEIAEKEGGDAETDGKTPEAPKKAQEKTLLASIPPRGLDGGQGDSGDLPEMGDSRQTLEEDRGGLGSLSGEAQNAFDANSGFDERDSRDSTTSLDDGEPQTFGDAANDAPFGSSGQDGGSSLSQDDNQAHDPTTTLEGIDDDLEDNNRNPYEQSGATASGEGAFDSEDGRERVSSRESTGFGEAPSNDSLGELASEDPQPREGLQAETGAGDNEFLTRNDLTARGSDVAPNDPAEDSAGQYQAPIGNEFDRDFQDNSPGREDSRSNGYQKVMRHTGRARSTTIVGRSPEETLDMAAETLDMATEEPATEEPAAELRSERVTDRLGAYRPVASHRGSDDGQFDSGTPEQFLDDPSNETESAETSASASASATDVERNSTSPDRLTSYGDRSKGMGDQFSAADDNKAYGFNEQETSSTARHQDLTSGENNGRAEHSRRERSPGSSYVIEANDSFWSIAQWVYDDPRYFQALARHNQGKIPNPRAMRPGVVIETPRAEELERLYPELLGGTRDGALDSEFGAGGGEVREGFAEKASYRGRFRSVREGNRNSAALGEGGFFVGRDGQPQYRVSPGDTLGSIAREHLYRASRWEEIHRLNARILPDPNRLKIGTVLQLPADAISERIAERPVDGR